MTSSAAPCVILIPSILVTINFNVARYADVLHMMKKGINPACEDSLLAQYPPKAQIHLDRPTVVCDKFGIIIFWYLPSAIDLAIQVSWPSLPNHYIDCVRMTWRRLLH
jgi:hypothetical protein